MAVHFNESTVAAETIGNNVQRQRMLTNARVKGTNILLDRLTLGRGAVTGLNVPAGNLAWFQVLEGEIVFKRSQGDDRLSEAHIVFLPPDFTGTLSTQAGAVLLYAEIPDAGRFDPAFAKHPPQLRVVDWTREPVLDSEHDARKRIFLVTPKLAGTKAIKGEMIIYPPGTAAANHHHEGAEHFMYVLRGRGTVYANEQPFAVKQGDIIYYPDRERHYLEAAPDEELVFAEFFAPAEFKTVWVDESQVCTWNPSGRDIQGRLPAREIKRHSVAEAHPEDV